MAAKQTESYKNRYSYIPPSVQKTMSEHMERTMPAHLKKYSQEGAYIPKHAEKALTEHMQKNLPSHLKQYADPYMQQHVIWSNTGAAPASASPASASSGRTAFVRGPRQNQSFTPGSSQLAQSGGPRPEQENNQDTDPYGFIMNPQKPPRRPFILTGGSMIQRVLLMAGGLIVLIILISVVSSFLNQATNAQKDKLISLARTQAEIVRVVDTASQKVGDKNLLFKAVTVKASVESTQQEVIAAISKRGKKVKDKDISFEDPSNDAALSKGAQNGHYDETYRQLLQQQLGDYQKQLQDVYNSGNTTEKNMAISANEQIKLLLDKPTQ